MDISLALRKVRFEKNAKQYDVAKKAKISASYLSQVESGAKHPSQKLVEKLCKIYSIPYIVLVWYGTQESDVKKDKQSAFRIIKQPMDNFISEFIK